MTRRKPRLTLAEYRLLCEIRSYAVRWRIRDRDAAFSAPSDVMDGGYRVEDPEVRGLVRKKLLGQYRHGDPSVPYHTTWDFTERGARLVIPEAFASVQSAGGKARAAKLSSERRAEIARKGATARWSKRSATPTPESPP